MNDHLPSVTVIIAARPDQTEIKAVDAARQLDYPSDRLEIVVARGKQPSVQRNAAMRAAQGELIYFLDDDSVPQPKNIRHAAKHFADGTVKMVGGPSLCPPDAPLLEQVFAVVLASWFPFGPSRARYAALGEVRPTSEKELILCNQIVRRDAVLELGGFNEALYPNEENALMDDLQKRGGKLIYDPQLVVYRRPRRTLKSFAKMLLTYGRGRAEQFRLNPTFGSALNLIPPLICLYLAALLIFECVPMSDELARFKSWAAAPLAIYLLAAVLQTGASILSRGVLHGLLAFPLVVAGPILYGFGFWRGLFTKLKAPVGEAKPSVRLETIAR